MKIKYNYLISLSLLISALISFFLLKEHIEIFFNTLFLAIIFLFLNPLYRLFVNIWIKIDQYKWHQQISKKPIEIYMGIITTLCILLIILPTMLIIFIIDINKYIFYNTPLAEYYFTELFIIIIITIIISFLLGIIIGFFIRFLKISNKP
jgi:hypothetical protein